MNLVKSFSQKNNITNKFSKMNISVRTSLYRLWNYICHILKLSSQFHNDLTFSRFSFFGIKGMKYRVMSSHLISTTLKRSVRKKVTKNSDEKKVKKVKYIAKLKVILDSDWYIKLWPTQSQGQGYVSFFTSVF